MALRDQINSDLTTAMKAGDKRRVSTLRMVNSTLKNADIEARGAGKEPLADADVLAQFQRMIKQRQESLDIYQKAGRTDLATQEKEEIDIISSYLPQQMSEHEIAHVVGELLKELGAQGMKDMGRTMAQLKERFGGKMDFGKAGAVVKRLLASVTPHKGS
jgi:uncharacterized protein YqeY